jgi:SAM-dependent methyltransferase
MSKKEHSVQQYWDNHHIDFGNYYNKPTLFDKIFRRGVFQRIDVATSACLDNGAKTVLDVGSGPGFNSITMVKRGGVENLVGIDFSKNMIEDATINIANAELQNKCKFILDDFITYKFNANEYDASVALGVFDYVEDAQSFLKKMAFLSTKIIVGSWPENGLRMLLRRQRYTCNLYHYTESDLRRFHREIQISDLEIIKIRGGWVTIAHK